MNLRRNVRYSSFGLPCKESMLARMSLQASKRICVTRECRLGEGSCCAHVVLDVEQRDIPSSSTQYSPLFAKSSQGVFLDDIEYLFIDNMPRNIPIITAKWSKNSVVSKIMFQNPYVVDKPTWDGNLSEKHKDILVGGRPFFANGQLCHGDSNQDNGTFRCDSATCNEIRCVSAFCK